MPAGHRSEAGDIPTGAGRGAQATGRRPVPRWVRSGMMARQARVAPHRRTVVSPSMIKRPVPLTLTARRTPSRLAYWRTLLVGPAGVFLLDSKRWRGRVTVENEVVTIRHKEDPELSWCFGGAGRLRGLARVVHERVLEQTRLSVWVEPVCVIWADFPQAAAGESCRF